MIRMVEIDERIEMPQRSAMKQTIAMGITDPVGKPVSKNRTQCYNALTDILWSWSDVSEQYEPVHYQWMHHTSHASRYHPEIDRYRRRVLHRLALEARQ